MDIATTKRWNLAQDYEKNWWDSKKDEVDFSFYEYYAEELKDELKDFCKLNEDTKILEIGSGAGGIVTYLKESKNRYAIDPLEDFYKSINSFAEQRDKSVKYYNSMGEDLPFDNQLFDLIIMDNVLDHCELPEKVLHETDRVLTDKGIIYFKQNTYNVWGIFIRTLMEKFLIDKGHPHTFSKAGLKSLMKKNNFKILKSSRAGYFKTWLREIKSKSLKDKIKALLFVTRDKVTYVILKQIH